MIPSSSLIALFNSKCFFCVYVLLVTPRNYEEKVTATLVCTCRIPKHSIMIYDWVAHCQSQTEPPNSSSHIFFQSKLGVTQTIARQLPLAACTGKVGNMILKQTLRAANDPVALSENGTDWKLSFQVFSWCLVHSCFRWCFGHVWKKINKAGSFQKLWFLDEPRIKAEGGNLDNAHSKLLVYCLPWRSKIWLQSVANIFNYLPYW